MYPNQPMPGPRQPGQPWGPPPGYAGPRQGQGMPPGMPPGPWQQPGQSGPPTRNQPRYPQPPQYGYPQYPPAPYGPPTAYGPPTNRPPQPPAAQPRMPRFIRPAHGLIRSFQKASRGKQAVFVIGFVLLIAVIIFISIATTSDASFSRGNRDGYIPPGQTERGDTLPGFE